MPIERVKELNELAGPKDPGMVSVEFLTCTPAETTGRRIALFRCTQMILYAAPKGA